jgi:sec-independent protein translocase protein TatA
VFINDILQPTHLLFILVVALLVLGPKRLPEAGRALGKGIRDFRSAIGGEEEHRPSEPTVAPMAATPAPVIPASEPPLVHPRPTETAAPAGATAEAAEAAEPAEPAETGATAETAHPVS